VSAPRLSGRRVLVTGGLGFLGLNLVGPLCRSGARVLILSRTASPLARRWLAEAAEGPVEVLVGDIADGAALERALADVEIVVDLAGESGATRSLEDAQADMQVNVAGHLALLGALRRKTRPARVVFASSRLVYGVTGSAAVGETHATLPTSLYGLHKLTVEHYLRIHREHFGIPFTILRITNPYGPFQLPHRRHYGLLNQFVMSAIRGDALPLYGGGGQLRDYVHARDVAEAILAVCASDACDGETFNLGSGESVALAAAARAIVRLAGSGQVSEVAWPEGARRVETGDFACDVSRLRACVGWSPRVGLQEGLATTIEAYRRLLPDPARGPA
jgi:nucleoside-diphosphate-sugar epimerase